MINFCSNASAADADMGSSGSGGVAGSTLLASVEMPQSLSGSDRRQLCREMLPPDYKSEKMDREA